jgi:hypothetical protein
MIDFSDHPKRAAVTPEELAVVRAGMAEQARIEEERRAEERKNSPTHCARGSNEGRSGPNAGKFKPDSHSTPRTEEQREWSSRMTCMRRRLERYTRVHGLSAHELAVKRAGRRDGVRCHYHGASKCVEVVNVATGAVVFDVELCNGKDLDMRTLTLFLLAAQHSIDEVAAAIRYDVNEEREAARISAARRGCWDGYRAANPLPVKVKRVKLTPEQRKTNKDAEVLRLREQRRKAKEEKQRERDVRPRKSAGELERLVDWSDLEERLNESIAKANA